MHYRQSIIRLFLFTALCLVLNFLCASPNFAGQRLKTIIVDGYQPYTFMNEKGEADGFSVDIARAVTKIMDLELDIRPDTRRHATEELEQGTIDLLPMMANSPERDLIFDFSVPHTIAYDTIFFKKGRSGISSIKDLSGKTVIVMNKDTAHEYLVSSGLSKTMSIKFVDSFPEALRELASGKGDAAIMPKLVGIITVKKLGIGNIEPSSVLIDEYNRPYSFAVKNGNQALLERLNQGLSIIKTTGQYDEIYTKWFGTVEESHFDWRIALEVSIIITAILTLFIFWNIILSRKVKSKTKHLEAEIEQRKLKEEELRDSEERLKAITDNATAIIFMKDMNGRLLHVNRLYKELFHLTDAEIIGKTDYDLFSKDFADSFSKNDQAVAQKGQPIEIEEHVRQDDGIHTYLSVKFPIKKSSGEIYAVCGIATDITSRKRAEEELRFTSEIMMNMAEAVYLVRMEDGIIVYTNQIFEKIFGYGQDEMIGKHVSVVNAPTEKKPEDTARIIMNSINENGYWRGVVNNIKKDGTHFWCYANVSVFDHSKYGRVLISVHTDITDQKLAEDAHKESEKQYHALLMNLNVGIVVHAPDTGIIISNTAASRILGLSENQMIGKEAIDPEWKFLRDDGTAMPVEEYPVNMVIRTGQPISKYVVGIKKNHTEQISWVLVSAYPWFFENNELQHVVVTFIDISELKQTETALLAEKERLVVTLRSIGDGVITTDTDGRITLMNKIAEELTGWKLRDSIGRPLDEVFKIINEKTRLACENPAHKVLSTGNTIELENHTVLISRDGDERVIADSGAPILDKNSKIIGVVIVFRDMTEKQKIEYALQNALKLESLNILAGGIAHDFNNLLGGIFGFIDMAMEYASDGDLENVKTSISDSMTVFERAKDLTMQLLTFAKGGDPVRKIGVIDKLVRDSFLFAMTGSNVSISFDIPDCPFMCDFDKNQISQIIDNMAINARQAMPMGGKLEVVLSKVPPYKAPALLPRVNYVKISITDNGPGISKENLQHIFDPFFTTKKQGTGLGLATCYSIVKRHDGIIEVETEQGKGTTFHIYLPEASGHTEIAATETKTTYKGNGRILIMDDQESIVKVTSSMLTRLGYSVASASNGDEAIEIVRQAYNENKPFVAAILDLTIPGGRGGKDTVDDILDIDSSIKLVAASGYSGDSIMSNPASFGFSACLIKPFRVNELTKVLEALAIGV